jgi:hypothetical protein
MLGSMRWWRAAGSAADALGLALSPEEGFVLSRLDQPLGAREIVEQTGLPAERVENILALLFDKGIVECDTPSIRPAAATIPDVDYGGDGGAPLDGAPDGGEPEPPVSAPPASTIAPLRQAYGVFANPHAPDDTRTAARDWVCARFADAPAEARVELIWETEGAIFEALDAVSLDGRVTALLCARTFTSAALVQRLVKLPNCPRLLLAHFFRQALVRRNPQLKKLVIMHPNLPPVDGHGHGHAPPGKRRG